MEDITIRPGTADDLGPLNDLYNHYVRETPVTFHVDPLPMEEHRAWFDRFATQGRYRLFVAVQDQQLLGYCTSTPVSPRPAYDTSVEVTVYLAADATGRGVGGRLYAALFAALAGQDVHRAYATIAMPNAASVALHEKFGFTRAGYFSEQGRKFGTYWDVACYEKKLP